MLYHLYVTQVDLSEIKKVFQQTYKKGLESRIQDDTGGIYRHILLELLKGMHKLFFTILVW